MASKFCKHYEGMHLKDSCAAGVSFKTLDNYGTEKFHDSCPCFSEENKGSCEFKEYLTLEEQVESDRLLKLRFAEIAVARDEIVKHCGGPWKRGGSGKSGAIDCPVCEKTNSLHFSRSGYNGHIHAKCGTDDCVWWME